MFFLCSSTHPDTPTHTRTQSQVFLRAGWSRGGKDGRDTGGSHSSATDYLPGGPTGQLGAGDRLYSMQPACGCGGGGGGKGEGNGHDLWSWC